MRIRIVTPAGPRSRSGNRVTALRWQRVLRSLGHRVTIETEYTGGATDLLVAIHAHKSAASVARWKRERPGAAVVVALGGTDVYPGLSTTGKRTLALADRIVALQPLAARQVPRRLRARVRTILQSAPPAERGKPLRRRFRLLVLAHLRAVKDPLRAAYAARLLPSDSRVEVVHAGGAHDEASARRARAEERRNPRYRWIGEVSRARAMALLAASDALVVSSRHEGGANVVSEALARGVPVLASRIPGNVGLLGPRHRAYFRAGDTRDLARLMRRFETDAVFAADLVDSAVLLYGERFRPEVERARWRDLLREIAPKRRRSPENPRAWRSARSAR